MFSDPALNSHVFSPQLTLDHDFGKEGRKEGRNGGTEE